MAAIDGCRESRDFQPLGGTEKLSRRRIPVGMFTVDYAGTYRRE